MSDFPMPDPTPCQHTWEHIWNINGVPVDAKHTDGHYIVWCCDCGSFGKAPCDGHGLEQEKVAITSLAYEDPHRRKPERTALKTRGAAMDAGVKC